MPRSAQSIIDHAEALADRFEQDVEPNPLDDEAQATVRELTAAVVDRGQAEARILAAVTKARGADVSWSVLAAVLGTSRQAAQQLYGSRPKIAGSLSNVDKRPRRCTYFRTK